MRHAECDLAEIFRRFCFRIELFDHLTVVAGLTKGLAIVFDHRKCFDIERLLELFQRDLLPLGNACHVDDEVRAAVVFACRLEQIHDVLGVA